MLFLLSFLSLLTTRTVCSLSLSSGPRRVTKGRISDECKCTYVLLPDYATKLTWAKLGNLTRATIFRTIVHFTGIYRCLYCK